MRRVLSNSDGNQRRNGRDNETTKEKSHPDGFGFGVGKVPAMPEGRTFVYDIETDRGFKALLENPAEAFVLGAIKYGPGCIKVWDHTQVRDFVTTLFSLPPGSIVYAHNGGRFDHLWLLDEAKRLGIAEPAQVIANSSGIVCLKIGKLQFRDSFRMFPMSLAKLTTEGDFYDDKSKRGKQSLRLLCRCGRNCGGYCAVTRTMSASVRRRVINYLKADVSSLWEALCHMREVADGLSINLGMTVGGTAWDSAYKELKLPISPFYTKRNKSREENGHGKIADWRFCREGYYGGRCELFRRESEAGYQYDVNSMYPYQISVLPLPIDYAGRRYGRSASYAFNASMPGLYRATVRVPESFIPPLPFRPDQSKAQILFPYGRIVGVWTLVELKYALTQGVKIERIHECTVWNRTQVMFAPWVKRLFDARMRYGKDTREGLWLKYIVNSITGKLGSSIDRNSIIVDACLSAEGPGPCFVHSDCGRKDAPDCGGWTFLGGPDSRVAKSPGYERVSQCGHVAWAAYLTSAARVMLHARLIEHDDAVYCDTDGIMCERPRVSNIGKALGEWNDEGQYIDFIGLAPKVYKLRKVKSGRPIVRAKGIHPRDGKSSLTLGDWYRTIAAGKPSYYVSMAGINRPIENQFFAMRKTYRTVNRNTGGRLPDGPILTRAPYVKA